jgi:hypothetical protein
MGKKYKDKLCVYCAERLSTTGDHVLGREFCLVKHRTNLPQVPACEQCNGEKSKLEHYLMTVLPFGGRHSEATTTLQTMVPTRLERNQKLHESLRTGYTGDKIPLEPGKIEALFVFITKGLLWHHFGVILTKEDRIAVTVIQSDGEGFLKEIFSRKAPKRVDENLGESTLVYTGLQGSDYAQFTIWKFLMYGGMHFAEESKDPNGKHSYIFAMTGPFGPLANLWRSIFKEELPAA